MRTLAWVLLALTGTLASLYVAVYNLLPDVLIYLGIVQVDIPRPGGGLMGESVSGSRLLLDILQVVIWAIAAVFSVLRITDRRPKRPRF